MLTIWDSSFLKTSSDLKLMNNSTLDLFTQHNEEDSDNDEMNSIEEIASLLEVTVDYYMMEFM